MDYLIGSLWVVAALVSAFVFVAFVFFGCSLALVLMSHAVRAFKIFLYSLKGHADKDSMLDVGLKGLSERRGGLEDRRHA